MPNPSDRPHFVVFCRDEFTDRKLVGAFTRPELIAEIIAARITDVQWVVEFNPVEGTAGVVSEDFARDLSAALEPGEPVRRDIRDFCEEQCGVGTVLRAAA